MYRIVKRLFDIIFSALVILLTSPLWLLIALGIKVSSPGPVFYISVRSGKGHKEFRMLKFRSMHVARPEEATIRTNTRGGFLADRERAFKFGSFLRKSKLDELPQLVNVFLGQMSVIGPRPYPERTVKKYYFGEYEKVMTVKPGLSCLDSLFDYAHGELFVSDNQEYAEKVLPIRSELAKMYVEKMNVSLDLYCIAKTVQLIFRIMVVEDKTFSYTKYEKEARDRIQRKQEAEGSVRE